MKYKPNFIRISFTDPNICINISEGDLPLPGRQGQGGTRADQAETKRDHQAAEG